MRPTRAYHRMHTDTRFARLPHDLSVLDIADHARAAGFVFVSDVRYGWGRRELATWLVHDYRRAVLDPFDPFDRPPASGETDAAPASAPPPDAGVARLVASARRHVVEMLATASTTWNPSSSFAAEMVESGLVVGVCDRLGGIGYSPVNQPRMRLADRVASLFIADYLTRPRDYDSLVVCPTCEEVSFRWDEVHEEGCDAVLRRSGLVARRRSTRRGVGSERAR